MTTDQIIALILGSAVLGAVVSSIINGIFNYRLKLKDVKEGRMKMALELTRMKREQVLEAARSSGAPIKVTLFDPAVTMSDYLAALDEIGRTGRWAHGDKRSAAHRPAGMPHDQAWTGEAEQSPK
jgi:hypothetical protein